MNENTHFIHKTLGDDFKVIFDKFFSCVPIFIPGAQTQIMFKDSIKNKFTPSSDF